MNKDKLNIYTEAGYTENDVKSMTEEQRLILETIVKGIVSGREVLEKVDPGSKKDAESLSKLRKELIQESDRGLCLLAIGRLDVILTKILEIKLLGSKTFKRDLFNNNGPLCTLSSKIKMSYSLGLITKNTYEEIEVMRKVRNMFAHSDQHISFDSKEVEDACSGMIMFPLQKGRKNRAKFITTFLFVTSSILAELRKVKPFEVKNEYLSREAIEKVAKHSEKLRMAFENPTNP